MGKSLIIGAYTNYNYNQLKPWVESIEEVGFTGDKVMIVFNSSKETMDELIKHDFKIIKVNQTIPNLTIHLERFFHIWNYLKNTWIEYDYVITTDVKDVYFQTNPETWLKERSSFGYNFSLVAGSESIRYENEPWGNQNLLECYGQYFHNEFKQEEIYNVGTLGGKSEYIRDLCLNIFLNGINRPIPIVDQAVFNVLIQTQPFKNVTYFAKQRDGWACQAGTTVDPSKINSFRPYLTEDVPSFRDGKVLTSTGEQFCIVHQYDRVPEWKKFIQEKYNQKDDSEFFTYRV